MTKEQVFTDPTFLQLTDKQQAFVRALIENGNEPIDAAHASYNCKDDYSANTIATRLLKKLAIKRLVGAYFDEKPELPTKEEFAASAWEELQTTQDANLKHKYYVLVSKLLWETDLDENTKATSQRDSKAADDLKAKLEARGL